MRPSVAVYRTVQRGLMRVSSWKLGAESVGLVRDADQRIDSAFSYTKFGPATKPDPSMTRPQARPWILTVAIRPAAAALSTAAAPGSRTEGGGGGSKPLKTSGKSYGAISRLNPAAIFGAGGRSRSKACTTDERCITVCRLASGERIKNETISQTATRPMTAPKAAPAAPFSTSSRRWPRLSWRPAVALKSSPIPATINAVPNSTAIAKMVLACSVDT